MSQNSKSANVIAPPKRKQGFGLDKLTAEPVPAADNMQSEQEVNMTFRVPHNFHQLYKQTAAMHRLSMKDILTESFELWQKQK